MARLRWRRSRRARYFRVLTAQTEETQGQVIWLLPQSSPSPPWAPWLSRETHPTSVSAVAYVLEPQTLREGVNLMYIAFSFYVSGEHFEPLSEVEAGVGCVFRLRILT